MPDLTDLIARVESAPPEMERELMEEGFAVLHPENRWLEAMNSQHTPDEELRTLEREAWGRSTLRGAIRRKLDAGAPLDAALMLVPERWLVTYLAEVSLGRCVARITQYETGRETWGDYVETLPLALLSAILRAARLRQEVEREGVYREGFVLPLGPGSDYPCFSFSCRTGMSWGVSLSPLAWRLGTR